MASFFTDRDRRGFDIYIGTFAEQMGNEECFHDNRDPFGASGRACVGEPCDNDPLSPKLRKNKRHALYHEKRVDTLFFDLVFTSSEHVMHLDALFVTGHQAVGFVAEDKDKKNKVQDYFEKELKARHIDMVYFHADSEAALVSRMKKRGDGYNDAATAAAQQDLIAMIKTAIV